MADSFQPSWAVTEVRSLGAPPPQGAGCRGHGSGLYQGGAELRNTPNPLGLVEKPPVLAGLVWLEMAGLVMKPVEMGLVLVPG